MNQQPHEQCAGSAAGDRVAAAASMARAALAPSALAQAARAAARRLPRAIVDDAEQEAWVRWLAAGGQAGVERQQADACAYLVGIFHHVCADAVRAHRRRQRWCALAADVCVEPMELVDECAAHGLGGIERLVEQVVRPAFADLPVADVDLWITAKIEGRGWHAAGTEAGMDRASIRRSRQRILRFLSTGDVLRRLRERLDDVP